MGIFLHSYEIKPGVWEAWVRLTVSIALYRVPLYTHCEISQSVAVFIMQNSSKEDSIMWSGMCNIVTWFSPGPAAWGKSPAHSCWVWQAAHRENAAQGWSIH